MKSDLKRPFVSFCTEKNETFSFFSFPLFFFFLFWFYGFCTLFFDI